MHASANGTRRRPGAPVSAAARHATMAPGNAASGARFGRIRIATPAAIPDRTADVNDDRCHATTRDSIQNAAAGTSLIGHSDIIRIVGLLAVSRAASAPVVRPETYDPSTAVR